MMFGNLVIKFHDEIRDKYPECAVETAKRFISHLAQVTMKEPSSDEHRFLCKDEYSLGLFGHFL